MMESALMVPERAAPIRTITKKLLEFSDTYQRPFPVDQWYHYPTHDQVDPMLGHWAKLSALALEKVLSSASTFRLKYRDQGLDHQSFNPNTSYVAEANKEIVLHELSSLDLLAIRTLKTLSETPVPKPEWVRRTGLSGENHYVEQVSPERAAQLAAFEELMQDVRSCKILQSAVSITWILRNGKQRTDIHAHKM